MNVPELGTAVSTSARPPALEHKAHKPTSKLWDLLVPVPPSKDPVLDT